MYSGKLTSSLNCNLAGFTGSQYDNAFNPGASSELGIWSKVTVDRCWIEEVLRYNDNVTVKIQIINGNLNVFVRIDLLQKTFKAVLQSDNI